MSVASMESFWQERQRALRHIQSQDGKKRVRSAEKFRRQLQATPPNAKSVTPTVGRGVPPAGTTYTPRAQRSPNINTHPPYGKYRRTPSPYLPTIEAEEPVKPDSRNLRRQRYEVVPPVKPRKAFVRDAEYDSWGEESDSEGSYDELPAPHPFPYPYPQYVPPPMVYGAPFPMYYPPPPRGSQRHQRHGRTRRSPSKAKGYRDMYDKKRTYQSYSKPRRQRHPPPVHYSVPMLNGYVSYPPYPVYNGHSDTEAEEFAYHKEHDPATYFKDHPLFAEDFVEFFITSCLEEEMVPDVLIDFIGDVQFSPRNHPLYQPAIQAANDLLHAEMDKMLRDIVGDVTTELANNYIKHGDPRERAMERLLSEGLRENCEEVVRDAIRDMVDQYMLEQTAETILDDLTDDYLQEIGADLVADSMFEVLAEDFIEEEVIPAEVEDMAGDIAKDLMVYYDNKITKREMKAVSGMAGDRLLDSLMLDLLLTLVAKQGKVYSESDLANKVMDELILNSLMEQYFEVQQKRRKTMKCRPLRKLHEKVVTDVALDVMLQQLTASLDEDLADVDEYERGVMEKVPTLRIEGVIR